jgi:hypothetical protein
MLKTGVLTGIELNGLAETSQGDTSSSTPKLQTPRLWAKLGYRFAAGWKNDRRQG